MSEIESAVETRALVKLQGVSQHFGQRDDNAATRWLRERKLLAAQTVTRAVDHVDLTIMPGEVVGLVGESGCGKSTLGRIVSGLITPTQGEVRVSGEPRAAMPAADLRAARLAIQMIFQDPYRVLNPRLRVARHRRRGAARAWHGRRVPISMATSMRSFSRAGLDPATRRSLSAPVLRRPAAAHRHRPRARGEAGVPGLRRGGGRARRVDPGADPQSVHGPARASSTSLISSSATISAWSSTCRTGSLIMYLGRIVESAPAEEIFRHPNHPYTQALLAEMPRIDARKRHFTAIRGEMPSPLAPPSGCHFHPRCPHAMPRCRTEVPRLRGIAIEHVSACHLNDAG